MIRILALNFAAILIFSIFYYILVRRNEEHFNGIRSDAKFMDCFYFACTVQSTVGFGDIYPKTSMAKTLVMLQQTMLIVGVLDLFNRTTTNVANVANLGNGMNAVNNKINVELK